MLVLAFLVLGFVIFDILSRFVVVWLHLTPTRPCLGVTIWDASSDAVSIRVYPSLFLLRAKLSLPCLFVPPIGLYASLHPCLHAHAWVLLASVSSMLQHNEAMDTRSKPTFVPHGHHRLFTFLLVCLFASLLAFWFLCFPWLSCLSVLCLSICSLHLFLLLFVYWFLVIAFACTPMERGGMELGHGPLGTNKKRRGRKHVNVSQAAVFDRFRSLAFPFWFCTLLNPFLPPPFLP